MSHELILIVFHDFLKVLVPFLPEFLPLLDNVIQHLCLLLSALLINIERSGYCILYSASMLWKEVLKLTILVSLVQFRLQTDVHSTSLGNVDGLAP